MKRIGNKKGSNLDNWLWTTTIVPDSPQYSFFCGASEGRTNYAFNNLSLIALPFLSLSNRLI